MEFNYSRLNTESKDTLAFVRANLKENKEMVFNHLRNRLSDKDSISYAKLIFEPDCFLIVRQVHASVTYTAFKPDVWQAVSKIRGKTEVHYKYSPVFSSNLVLKQAYRGFYGDEIQEYQSFDLLRVPVFYTKENNKNVLLTWKRQHEGTFGIKSDTSDEEFLSTLTTEFVRSNGRQYVYLKSINGNHAPIKLEIAHTLELTIQLIAENIVDMTGSYKSLININDRYVQIALEI